MPFSKEEIKEATIREHAEINRQCAELMDSDLFDEDLSEKDRQWIKESCILDALDSTEDLQFNTDFSLGCVALGIPIRFSWGLKDSQKLVPEDVLFQLRGAQYEHLMTISFEGRDFFVANLSVLPPDAYAKAIGPDAKLDIGEYELPKEYRLVPGSIIPLEAEVFNLELAERDFLSHG